METRGQSINYPSGPSADVQLLRFLSRLLKLERLQRIELTAQSIFVSRLVTEGEDVLPQGLSQVLEMPELPDVEFLLQRLELMNCSVEAPSNPVIGLHTAVRDLEARGLIACAVLAPEGDYFDAYFGFPEDANVDRFLGMLVVRSNQIEGGKLVILGSVLGMAVEATHGVVLDTGVIV